MTRFYSKATATYDTDYSCHMKALELTYLTNHARSILYYIMLLLVINNVWMGTHTTYIHIPTSQIKKQFLTTGAHLPSTGTSDLKICSDLVSKEN